jgi:outer membrane lipoprotein-sorting protein
MVLILALLMPVQRPDQVLERFFAYQRGLTSLRVEIALEVGAQRRKGTATLIYQKPQRTRFDLKMAGSDYSFASTEQGSVEIDWAAKQFDERPWASTLGYPPPRMTEVNFALFPDALIYFSRDQMMPKDAEVEFRGQEHISGQSVDHIRAHWMGSLGPTARDLYVSPEGRLLRYEISNGETVVLRVQMSRFEPNPKLDLKDFTIDLPPGLRQYALPSPESPEEVGLRLKYGSWWSSRAKSMVDPGKDLKGAPHLLVFVRSGCLPSARLLKALPGLASGDVVTFTLDKEDAGMGASYVDRSGAGQLDLSVPSTPAIYLVDDKGVLNRVWYGYDPESKETFFKDIRDAVAGLKK